MLKQIRTNLLVLSVLFVGLGLCLLVYPTQSQSVLCAIVGGAVAVYGVWGILHYLIVHPVGIFAQCSMVFSLLCVALGVFLLLRPDIIVSALPFVFGILVLADGLVRLPTAIQLLRAGYSRWWSYLLLAAVSVGLGAFIVLRPFETAVLMFQALGVVLVIEGALNIFTTLYASLQLRAVQKAVDEALRETPPALEMDEQEKNAPPAAAMGDSNDPAATQPANDLPDPTGPDLQL